MALMLTQEEVSTIGGDHFSRIASVIEGAFEDYQRSLSSISAAGIRTDLRIRTAASLVHDMISSRSKLEFSSEARIKVGEFNGIFGMVIDRRIFVRFKKLNSELKTSNIPTQQAQGFIKQQLELPGFGKLTLLTAGYLLSPTGTAIRNIYLTCRRGNDIIWHRDLRGGESGSIPLFGPDLSPNDRPKVPTERPPLVVLKGGKNDSSQTGS
ncbi:MAG: hypothetical protein HOP08_19940 [Cyclobacteriaceae bacterium]|nr:hypothetical protein [Cyclobacteriaceae bacterium]